MGFPERDFPKLSREYLEDLLDGIMMFQIGMWISNAYALFQGAEMYFSWCFV